MSHLPAPDAAAAEAEVLDIQHDTDPARDHGPAQHIPHLGHAMLFFAMAFFLINVCALGFFSLFHVRLEAMEQHPGVALASQALAYVLILSIAALLFPRLWQKPYLQGLQWNALAARRRWPWILLGGVVLSAAAQIAERVFPAPKTSVFDSLLKTQHGAWLLAAFAVLLAPITEEIAFRGFLLPALATAYDWLSLERTPAGLERWQRSSLHSASAMIFGAVFSSVPFALLHAEQLSRAWGPIAVLYGISLVLSFVRLRTHSVACSALMHAAYNFTIFGVILSTTDGFHHLEKLSR